MTSKRSHGQGTIYKNKARNRLEGHLTVGIKPDGQPVKRKVSGRTKAEVIKNSAKIRDRCSQGPGLPSHTHRMTSLRGCRNELKLEF